MLNFVMFLDEGERASMVMTKTTNPRNLVTDPLLEKTFFQAEVKI